ncbi:MAG: hypothetical protein M3R71_02875 [Actinomycetota bacterium]|nr:hypothetical protein [Actinomycetota bacterium]
MVITRTWSLFEGTPMKRLLAKITLSLGLMAGLSMGTASVAGATPPTTVCYPSCTSSVTTVPGVPTTNSLTTQQPQTTVASANGGGSAADATAAAQGGQSLAFTGSDVVGTVVVATVLIAAGFMMIRLSRRRRSA